MNWDEAVRQSEQSHDAFMRRYRAQRRRDAWVKLIIALAVFGVLALYALAIVLSQ